MNWLDILIILVLAAAVFFAVRTIRKNKGGCSSCCSGDCSACARYSAAQSRNAGKQ